VTQGQLHEFLCIARFSGLVDALAHWRELSLSPGLVGGLAPIEPVLFIAASNAHQPAFAATIPPLVVWTLPAESLAVKPRGPGLMAKWTPVSQDRALDQVFSDQSLELINDELLSRLAAGV
jgi:hypothetical protein